MYDLEEYLIMLNKKYTVKTLYIILKIILEFSNDFYVLLI